jgi:hypothetical protein
VSDAIKLIAQRISKEVGTSSAESYRIAKKLGDMATAKGWTPASVGFKPSRATQGRATSVEVRRKPNSTKLYRVATKMRDLPASKGWTHVGMAFKASGTTQKKVASGKVRKKPNSIKLRRVTQKLRSQLPSKRWAASSRGIRKKRNRAKAGRRRG